MKYTIIKTDQNGSSIVEGPFQYSSSIAIRLLAKHGVKGVSLEACLETQFDFLVEDYIISLSHVSESEKPNFDPRVEKCVENLTVGTDTVMSSWVVTPLNIDIVKNDFINKILYLCEEYRGAGLTQGTWKALTYSRKGEEAKAYINNPAGSYPLLEEEAVGMGVTVADLASEINSLADAWNRKVGNIEGIQRSKTAAINSATTNAEVVAIYDGIVWPI